MTKRRGGPGQTRKVTRHVPRKLTWGLVLGCACMAVPAAHRCAIRPDGLRAADHRQRRHDPGGARGHSGRAACHDAPATPTNAPPVLKSGEAAPISGDQPVSFTADHFEYDRTNGIVTASGHVEAWQNDHLLRADKITFDRNTNVAAAQGNVVLVEPDGQVLFSDYAELTQGMRQGVLRDMRTCWRRTASWPPMAPAARTGRSTS